MANHPIIISAIKTTFHTTQHDDQAIAQIISSQGIFTTANQVKKIRLAQGWRRHTNNKDQLAQKRAETFTLIKQVLQQEEYRYYGRELLKTYLCVKFQYNVRDQKGRESHRPGPKKSHIRGEFIIPGQDWLWCCDGHDKFCNYAGIEIYARVDAYSRRIQWCYVGNSNHQAVSILRQVVTTI